MGHFNHFKLGVYCTAQTLSRLTEERLEAEWAYLEKYVGVDRPYKGDGARDGHSAVRRRQHPPHGGCQKTPLRRLSQGFPELCKGWQCRADGGSSKALRPGENIRLCQG